MDQLFEMVELYELLEHVEFKFTIYGTLPSTLPDDVGH